MQFGKMRFFRKIGINYILLKNGYIRSVDFFFDITLNTNEFSFVAFFSKNNEQNSAVIMIDIEGKIGGVTENFFEKLGFKSSDVKKIDVRK
jgi:hypothetical protein